MDFAFGARDEAFRAEARTWLAAHRGATRGRDWERTLGATGWIGLGWPEDGYGNRTATLTQQVVWAEEYARCGAPPRSGHIGENLLAPTLLAHGDAGQKRGFLPPVAAGEELWCQGYSEPGAGSDLAGVRTAAVRDGAYYRISGQKIWTSLAHEADWCFVLARTDPRSRRHHGLSFLLVPMDQPGRIEVRPICWLLPAGWAPEPNGPEGRGVSKLRVLARAWPVYVTGAAGLSLLSLAELILPARLEQRGIGVGWAGPLLTVMSVASAVGAFGYGLRSWPGRLATRSVVLMAGMSAAVCLVALIPAALGMAVAPAAAGLLQSGALLTRNLSLREALPSHALAAGYSVMYAAVGAGYAATGSLAGALLRFTTPSTAILAGVALTLSLTAVGWWGEIRARGSARGAGAAGPVGGVGAEGAAVGGGGDAQRGL
ncbi:acyl-CoA dehydrogenase family protein [Streptomyces achromogenes]|uniref:acyl-CoA dehydrogenase family protein n=1 Tax=Streptomyces achromogenes TaxID=67255 RepID=UPI0036FAEFD4